jgi:hypothetical protein
LYYLHICDIYNIIMDMNALVFSLPTRNSTLRMRVWRALRDTGCGVLRDGVYLLPSGRAALKEMESDIRASCGFAMTVDVTLKSAEQLALVRRLFDRTADYGALVQKISADKGSLPRLGSRRAQTKVERLERSFNKIAATDFFAVHAKQQATDAIEALKRTFQEAYSSGEPHLSRKRLRQRNRPRYQKRIWATRKDLWVDRLASAWLIKRFIDREAKFLWIESPHAKPRKVIGFDFDGAEFTHVDNRVTFEVLLASFGLENDAALVAIGALVHYLDVGGIPVADAKGLETLLRGFKQKSRSDDALLAEATRILDSFYSAYKAAGAQ